MVQVFGPSISYGCGFAFGISFALFGFGFPVLLFLARVYSSIAERLQAAGFLAGAVFLATSRGIQSPRFHVANRHADLLVVDVALKDKCFAPVALVRRPKPGASVS
jgi:hypothetical protein